MKFSQPCGVIVKQFAHAQDMCVSPKKSKQNQHLKNHYATLGDVAAAIGPAMEDAGLIMIQSPTHEPGQPANVLLMETRIIHTDSGEWLSDVCQIPLAKTDSQGFGSALTYARRYARVAIFGLTMDDDDGNKSVRSAADCRRSIEAAKDKDEVDAIYRAASELFRNDKASLRIVEDARASKIVELKNAEARPFNPGKPANARRGKATVQVAPDDVQPQDVPPKPEIEEDF
ncbi:hypothetical protein [Klebsiella phage phiKp_7-2]|uniref:Recombinase n=1 Tax=Klebsiella phage PMBT64 TaxID=3229740 RepID=A0AB39C4P1_9CAUD|nr:hypothetical protein [Klebsiella phage phiKp_7-2]